jgi:hypothetical protein
MLILVLPPLRRLTARQCSNLWYGNGYFLRDFGVRDPWSRFSAASVYTLGTELAEG